MNDNFRRPEFVKRYEYNYYDLETPLNSIVANNARQTKDNYRFTVDNSSEANPIDWYNAYLEADFKLVTPADSTTGITAGTDNVNKFCTTTNGQTFIKEIQVECNGITVYNNTRANESSNVLSMLKYTKSYADTVGKDQFFYLDSSTGTAEPRPAEALYNEGFDAAAVNNISIPLNSYSYFAAFKNNLQQNIKTNILLTLENDNNIIFKNAGAANSKIIFNGAGLKAYLEDYLKPKKWIYQKEHHEIKQSGATNDSFRISTGIRRQRHVFIWAVPTLSYNNQGANIFTFGISNSGGNRAYSKAQLELNNGTYYPQSEMTSVEESRLYRTLMSYSSAYNDFLSGS